MPASFTHYAFGKDVLSSIRDNHTKEIIQQSLNYYNIGLHGPDFLFYYKPYIFNNRINKYASKMHHSIAYPFFDEARNHISNNDQLAYILGFICHYCLDSKAHGYVSTIMNESGVGHFEVESEYDRRIMMKDDLNPTHTPLVSHLTINQEISDNISVFFPLQKEEIYKSLKGIQFYDRLFLAPNPFKRGFIYLVYHLTFHFKDLQGTIMNYKQNKKLLPFFDHFDDLYQQAIGEAVDLIEEYVCHYNDHTPLSDRYNRDYE